LARTSGELVARPNEPSRKRRSPVGSPSPAPKAAQKRVQSQYTLVWDKIAKTTKDASSESDTQDEEDGPNTIQDTPFHAVDPEVTPDVRPNDRVEEGEYVEIVEEPETEGCHTCPPSSPESDPEGGHRRSPGGSYMSHEPYLNLKEVKEGGRDQPSAAELACGSPPLKREEEELAFQHLCQLWQIRDEFWPDIDVAKAREAFAAVSSEFGDQIRRENPGVSFGYYMLARARVWIDAFVTAHPKGDGPRFLKKLEVWLGAPDGKNNATPWWQKMPTPNARGSRSRKPDLFNVALNGGHAA
jgi:hypothetical protein